MWKNFFTFFVDKVDFVRRATRKTFSKDFSVVPAHSAVLDQFELVSLYFLGHMVKSLKPTNCPLDVVPARRHKIVLILSGLVLWFLSIPALVPAAFKHAVVRPLLKKPVLDSCQISDLFPICPFSLKF